MPSMRHVALLLFVSLTGVARAEDKPAKGYEITTALDPASVASGGSTKLVLNIAAKAPYVLKNETPFKAVLTTTPGLTLAKGEFTSKDFDDPKAPAKSISTAVTAAAKGPQQITADLTFFLCTEQLCERFKDKVTVPVAVK